MGPFVLQISLISLLMDCPVPGSVSGGLHATHPHFFPSGICQAWDVLQTCPPLASPPPLYPNLLSCADCSHAWGEEQQVFCLTVWSPLLSAWPSSILRLGTVVYIALQPLLVPYLDSRSQSKIHLPPCGCAYMKQTESVPVRAVLQNSSSFSIEGQ